MKALKISLVLVFFLGMFFSSLETVDAAKYEMKMHVNQPATQNSYHYVLATTFAEKVYRYSDGAVSISIFPGGQLGEDPAVFQQLQVGGVQLGVFAFPNLVEFYKRFNIFTLPFLFEDFNSAAFAMQGPTAKAMYEDFEKETGVKVLGVFNGGFRGITNNIRLIEKAEDFHGLKIRCPGSPIIISTLQSLGMNPTSISPGEIFTALQVGTVDGQESTVSWAYGQGYADVQKFLTLTRHAVTGTGLYINSESYNKLPDDIQKAVDRAISESIAYTNGFCRLYDRVIVENFKEAGLEVSELKTSEVRPKVEEVWEEFAPMVGGMEQIEQLVKDGTLRTQD